jgi:hypothetical protein
VKPSRRIDISVLVPVRNEAAFIAETGRLILAQEFEGEAEFLMIDGACDDGTRALLDELTPSDARVKVLENSAGDLASALNVGLGAARAVRCEARRGRTRGWRNRVRERVEHARTRSGPTQDRELRASRRVIGPSERDGWFLPPPGWA